MLPTVPSLFVSGWAMLHFSDTLYHFAVDFTVMQ